MTMADQSQAQSALTVARLVRVVNITGLGKKSDIQVEYGGVSPEQNGNFRCFSGRSLHLGPTHEKLQPWGSPTSDT